MIVCEVTLEQETSHDKEHHDFQTKATIQISKVIGEVPILKEYDALRANLKKKSTKHRGKPSSSKKKNYYKLLSQLQTQVLSTKHKLKAEIKQFERNYYCKHGMLPNKKEVDYVDWCSK